MDKLSAYGYLVHSLDALYLNGNEVTDEQRDAILRGFKDAIEHLEEADAITYYIQNSNTNIKL